MANRTIMLYGPTGGGKSTQVGELATSEFIKTGKRTRLYSADFGGIQVVEPQIRAGIIDPVILGTHNPWAYEYAAEGKVPGEDGRWQLSETNQDIGLWAFESSASFGALMMQDLADRAAGRSGRIENIGGQAPVRFNGQVDGLGVWIGSNNQSHYGIVQRRLQALMFKSSYLPGTVIWTSLDGKGLDKESNNPIIGPVLVGKAMIEDVPSWFNYTFRIVALPRMDDKPPDHRLYLTYHTDATTGGMAAVANSRQPMLEGAPPMPVFISPASLVKALELVQGREDAKFKELQRLT